MTPYYDEDGITIYHGDCRDVLPGLNREYGGVVVTDPPYGNATPYESYEDSPSVLAALATEVYPLLRAGADLVALTPGVGNIHKWPAPTWTLCWFEASGSGSGPWGFCTWQPILVYGADPYLAAGLGRRPDGFTAGRGGRLVEDRFDSDHPVPKPLAVGRWIIERVCPTPQVVIDPFMGGGTFLRAARDLGHRAIGIELEERYCEIAVQRLAQGVLDFA